MSTRRSVLFLLTAFVISFMGGAQDSKSQSWCPQAKTPVEKTICADASLGARDEYISGIYAALYSAVSEKDKLRSLQRAWLKERGACGPDKLCLQSRYDQMIAAYRQLAEKINLQVPAPGFAAATTNAQDGASSQVTVNPNSLSIAEVDFDFAQTAANGNSIDALVVASSNYASIPDLQTPSADAEIVSAAFKSRGIASSTITDPNREELASALMAFIDSPRKDVFVFYYAGHAADINGKPSVLFRDFKLEGTRTNGQQQPIDEVIGAISRLGYKKVLIIFDACRNLVEVEEAKVVPLPNSPASNKAATYRNLGSHSVDLNPLRDLDYAISFSAAEGQFALDTVDGRNSPFAAAFSQNIREKETFFDAIIETRRDVKSATSNRQQPSLEMSWDEDLTLSSTIVKSVSIALLEERQVIVPSPHHADFKQEVRYGTTVTTIRHKVDDTSRCALNHSPPTSAQFSFFGALECVEKHYDLQGVDKSGGAFRAFETQKRDGIVRSCESVTFVVDLDTDGRYETVRLGSDRYGGVLTFERDGHVASYYSMLGCNFEYATFYDIDQNGTRDVIIPFKCEAGDCLVMLSGEKLVANVDGTFYGPATEPIAQYMTKPEWMGILAGLTPVALFYDENLKWTEQLYGNTFEYRNFGPTWERDKSSGMPNKKVRINRDGTVEIESGNERLRLSNFQDPHFSIHAE